MIFQSQIYIQNTVRATYHHVTLQYQRQIKSLRVFVKHINSKGRVTKLLLTNRQQVVELRDTLNAILEDWENT